MRAGGFEFAGCRARMHAAAGWWLAAAREVCSARRGSHAAMPCAAAFPHKARLPQAPRAPLRPRPTCDQENLRPAGALPQVHPEGPKLDPAGSWGRGQRLGAARARLAVSCGRGSSVPKRSDGGRPRAAAALARQSVCLSTSKPRFFTTSTHSPKQVAHVRLDLLQADVPHPQRVAPIRVHRRLRQPQRGRRHSELRC